MIREFFKEINSRILYKLVVTDILTRGTTKTYDDTHHLNFQHYSQKDIDITYEICLDFFGDNVVIYGLLLNNDLSYEFEFPYAILSPSEKLPLDNLEFFNIKPSLINKQKYNITKPLINDITYNLCGDIIHCDFCNKYLEPPYFIMII